jgi:hypothetical protein
MEVLGSAGDRNRHLTPRVIPAQDRWDHCSPLVSPGRTTPRVSAPGGSVASRAAGMVQCGRSAGHDWRPYPAAARRRASATWVRPPCAVSSEARDDVGNIHLLFALGPAVGLAVFILVARHHNWVRWVRRELEWHLDRPSAIELDRRRDVDGLVRMLESRETADGAMRSLVRMTWDGDLRLTNRIITTLVVRCVRADPDPRSVRGRGDYGAEMARQTLVECGEPALHIVSLHIRYSDPKAVRAAGLVLAGLAARGDVAVAEELKESVECRGEVPWSYWELVAEVVLCTPPTRRVA